MLRTFNQLLVSQITHNDRSPVLFAFSTKHKTEILDIFAFFGFHKLENIRMILSDKSFLHK